MSLFVSSKLSSPKIAVIGLGYVGLPLAVAFGRIHPTIGFDVDGERIDQLRRGYDRTTEVDAESIRSAQHLIVSDSPEDIVGCDHFIITVPTPLMPDNRPDLRPLREASITVGRVIEPGAIVIYESTVYPGVTEDICVPILEESSGLKFNQDFFCGYSPERTNPGDREHTLSNTVKITAGSTPQVALRVDELYKTIVVAGTHLAPSIRVAEAAKVFENTQRDVNIALMNELALICDAMKLNTQDVLAAASTKWNFLPFVPGLVGGHCIGIDPYYLTYKAQQMGYTPNLILASRQINDGMGKFIARKTIELLIERNVKIKGAKVLILGITFKENCPDARNSRSLDIAFELNRLGCIVSAYDPLIDMHSFEAQPELIMLTEIPARKLAFDAVIFAVAHNQFAQLSLEDFEGALIVDVKGFAPRADWTL